MNFVSQCFVEISVSLGTLNGSTVNGPVTKTNDLAAGISAETDFCKRFINRLFPRNSVNCLPLLFN